MDDPYQGISYLTSTHLRAPLRSPSWRADPIDEIADDSEQIVTRPPKALIYPKEGEVMLWNPPPNPILYPVRNPDPSPERQEAASGGGGGESEGRRKKRKNKRAKKIKKRRERPDPPINVLRRPLENSDIGHLIHKRLMRFSMDQPLSEFMEYEPPLQHAVMSEPEYDQDIIESDDEDAIEQEYEPVFLEPFAPNPETDE